MAVAISPKGKITRYLYDVAFDPATMKMALLEASEGKIGTPLDSFVLWCMQYDANENRYSADAKKLLSLAAGAFVVDRDWLDSALLVFETSDETQTVSRIVQTLRRPSLVLLSPKRTVPDLGRTYKFYWLVNTCFSTETLRPFLADLNTTFWFPEQASTFAKEIDSFYNFILWLCIVFFVLIVAGMIYFTVKFRDRPGYKGNPEALHNTPLEITWTVLYDLLVIYIFVRGTVGYLDMASPPADTLDIQVTASKWSWGFQYPNGAISTSCICQSTGQPR